MNLRCWGLGLVVMGVIGCSGDDESTPTEKCNALIDQWCNKMLDCYVQNGQLAASERPTQLTQCKQAAGEALNCSAAVGVSSTYGACQNDLGAFQCSSVSASTPPTLPQNCKGVILLSNK